MKKVETEKNGIGRRAALRSMAVRVKHRLKNFRRLEWDELVQAGDFLANEANGFEPWDGPGGFRADSFLKPIYRLRRQRARG